MNTRSQTTKLSLMKRTLALAALILTATPGLASASQDFCEKQFQSVTQTGVLTRRTVKAYAELNFSEAQQGMITLSTASVQSEGIPQLPKTLEYTTQEFSIRLERSVDQRVRVNHLTLSSPLGSATFQLVAGALIENLVEIRLENDKLLDELDLQKLTLNETLRLLGFGGEMRQAALNVLQSECSISQGARGTRLLQGIIRKFDKPAPHRVPWLGCPPCELERELR